MCGDTNSNASGLIRRANDETHTQRLSDRIDQAYEAYKAGNSAGSTELYEALLTQARNVVWFKLPEFGIIRVRELAHDIATRAIEKIDQFRGESKFSTWFYTIAQNEVDRALEEHITRRNTVVSIDPDANDGEEDWVASDEPTAPPPRGQDAMIELEILMSELSDDDVTLMRFKQEGYTLEEIAEKTGEPLGTIRSRYERAKAKMAAEARKNSRRGI
jgi:RNA polymerase sigma-70 factor (ECF subfamily)